MEFGGRMRKLLIHPGRTGFVFVLDRGTGELLSAEQIQPVNWAHRYDLSTGNPVDYPAKRTSYGRVYTPYS
jgi:glucose dehydrogenase